VKSFLQFLEDKSPGVVVQVNRERHRFYHVVAYSHEFDSTWVDVHTTINVWDVQVPKGFTINNAVGYARFIEHPYSNYWYAARVDVAPEWRRKGIATKMYDAFTQKTGIKPKPAEDQLDDGKAFWKSRT